MPSISFDQMHKYQTLCVMKKISVCNSVIRVLYIVFDLRRTLLQLIYEKLPADIASRHVFLLDPVLATGLYHKHIGVSLIEN